MSDVGVAEMVAGPEAPHANTAAIDKLLNLKEFNVAAHGVPPVIDWHPEVNAAQGATFPHPELGVAIQKILPGALVVLAGVALFNFARNRFARRQQ